MNARDTWFRRAAWRRAVAPGGGHYAAEVGGSPPSAGAVRWVAAGLSLGAGGIHFAVSPEHFAEYWLFGWLFVIAAWFQACWALAMVSSGTRRVALAGAVVNIALVAVYLWTRLVSVPVGPEAGEPEAATLLGGAVLIFEVLIVAAALSVVRAPREASAPGATPGRLLGAAVLCVIVGAALAIAST